MSTRRNGQDWYVLLIGSYSSFEEADTAGREYAEATGQSFWMRDANGLKAMEVREDYGS